MSFLETQKTFKLESFPASIQLVQYNSDYYKSDLFLKLAPQQQQPDSFNQWVIQRQAQFLAGRLAAQNSLHANNYKPVNIGIGSHKQPIWPSGVIGSISHASNISISTVLDTDMHSGCGLDIQALLTVDEIKHSISIILSQQDQIIFPTLKDSLANSQLETLIFSAKESYFKSVFNSIGKYFNFNDISIISLDTQHQTIKLRSHNSSVIKPPIELTVYYHFLLLNKIQHVITYAVY